MSREHDSHIAVSIGLPYLSGVVETVTRQLLAERNIPVDLNRVRVEELEAGASLRASEIGTFALPPGDFELKGEVGPVDGASSSPPESGCGVSVWIQTSRLSEICTQLARTHVKQVGVGEVRVGRVKATGEVAGNKSKIGPTGEFGASSSVPPVLTMEQVLTGLAVMPRARVRFGVDGNVPGEAAALNGMTQEFPHIVVLISNSYLNEALGGFLTYFGPYIISTINAELVKWVKPSNLLRFESVGVRVDQGILKLETMLRFDLRRWRPDVTATADVDIRIHQVGVELRVLNVGLSGGSIADVPRWIGGEYLRSTTQTVLDWLVGKFVSPRLAARVSGNLPDPAADYRYEVTRYESGREYQLLLAKVVDDRRG